MNKKIFSVINIFAYSLIFLLFGSIFVYIFFPYNSLREPIKRLLFNKTGLEIKINSIYPSFPFAVTLSNIKIIKQTRSKYDTVVSIKSIKADKLIAMLFNYVIYKKILVNATFNNLKIYSIKMGFFEIPRFNIKKINTKLSIENYKKMSGILYFEGDLSGKLKINNSVIEPIFRINDGYFRVKPDNAIYDKFSTLFNTMFKKNKNGYFVYSIRNLIL